MSVARVTAVRREGTRAHGVDLELDRAWRDAYATPGQYVLLGADGVPLALASAPGAPVQVLLGEEAHAALDPVVGAELPISAPLGDGFPLESAVGREVLVFAVGTAASAARALIETIARARARHGRVRVYLGAHTHAAHAYLHEDPQWSAATIEVVRAISRPWVQELFLDHDPPSSDACVFAAGHDAAIAGIRAAMAARGLDPARLGLNVP